MKAADLLREIGRPIAYYPMLAKRLGGVNAAVLFCQIFYWQDKAESPLGVHKTRDELESETGLTHEEQATARRKLKKCGVLIETQKRIDHKVYFKIDESALEALLSDDSPETMNPGFGKPQTTVSGNRKQRFRETVNHGVAKQENTASRSGQSRRREAGNHGSVNRTETTAETTAATRASGAVDKSVAAAAENEKAHPNPNAERELTDLLIALEAARGKSLTVDRSRDRTHVLTWVGKGVTAARLREAHALAAAARKRENDDRPTYTGFISTFLDAEAATPPPSVPPADVDWWLAGEPVLIAAGEKLGARPKHRDESLPVYRAVVARAAGKGPWIDAILRDAQKTGGQFLQTIVATLGERLMPLDWYAS
ncbi:hypothetical protein [Burkholderia sp. Ax-1724]|uniref:hypothetical protein n=1 Tax=Burkholderia sp. Ax-1724 TaxID=2608336 RepID=UPI0014213164|nr:hypothetical protein [Burkholderia sp. Ax-1724]NIF51425.1 hypothetical protein [Burkholderia sp. Ax-1724]